MSYTNFPGGFFLFFFLTLDLGSCYCGNAANLAVSVSKIYISFLVYTTTLSLCGWEGENKIFKDNI